MSDIIQTSEREPEQQVQEPKRNTHKPLWIVLAVVFLAAILIVILILARKGKSRQPETVDIDQYLTVTYSGVNTKGTANVEFDTDAFQKDYGDKIHFTEDGKQMAMLWGYSDSLMAEYIYDNCVDGYYDIQPHSDLSNGDTVTLTWYLDDEDDEYGIKYCLDMIDADISYTEKTYNVSGLPEAEAYDPFEDLSVTFSGVNGYGTAEMDASGISKDGVKYSIDKKDALSNGDTVTVTFTDASGEDPTDYLMSRYGMTPSSLTKQYTVEGLQEVQTFNPFDYFDITFSGKDGQGIANANFDRMKALGINADECSIKVPITQNFFLKNGETVTITFRADPWTTGSGDTVDWFTRTHGLIPDPLTKDFTVTGLTPRQ